MVNPNKELFRWGPFDGRPIYTSYYMIAIAKQLPKRYKYKWPEILLYFIKDKMTFISDYSDLRKAGKKHFNTWLMNDKNLKKIEFDFDKAIRELNKFYRKISNIYLDSLNDKQLFGIYNKWFKLYIDFWTSGLVPELANWGGEQILKEELSKKIKNEKDFITAFEKLAAPERLSFYQEEQLKLLNLKKYEKTKNFNNLLKEHVKKYFWIRNNYFEQKVLNKEYFKKQLADMEEVHLKINDIENIPKKTINDKQIIIKKCKLNKKIEKISKRLSYSIWLQDLRKKNIFTTNHYIDLFLKEISKRKKIRFLDLKFYSGEEILKLLKNNKKISNSVINQRKKVCLLHYYLGNLKFETEEKTYEKVKLFLIKKVDKKIGFLKGLVVSFGKGVVKGKVRILLTPRNLNKMEEGEVLVAPLTSPDYVVAMRKAAAVVTDEGGMTSHAAIVSRELGITCIVGTKIATRLLKNGMKVEVDANLGRVKILEK